MTKGEFLELIKDLDENDELKFYVWDCEYEEDGFELGSGKVAGFDGYMHIKVNS